MYTAVATNGLFPRYEPPTYRLQNRFSPNMPAGLFRSHVETILHTTWDITDEMPVNTLEECRRQMLVRNTIRALANLNLAVEDEHEDYDAIEAACLSGEASELCIWLWKRGACAGGLTTVGQYVTEASLERVLHIRRNWDDWYQEERILAEDGF